MRCLLLLALCACQSKSPTPASASTPTPTPAPPKVADAAKPPPDAALPDGLPKPTDAQIVALERAKTAAEKGDAQGALAAYLRAGEGPPSGIAISARLAAADLLDADGKKDQALALHEGLLQDAGKLPEVQFSAARFFAVQGDVPRAIEGFKAAIQAQPDLLPAYPLLAALLNQEKRTDEVTSLMARYEVRLGKLLLRVKDVAQARDTRLDVIELLGVLDDDRASDTLRLLLKDGDPAIRTTAGGFLAEEPSPENLTALAEAAVAEKNPTARRVLAAALKRARADALKAPTPPEMPAPKP